MNIENHQNVQPDIARDVLRLITGSETSDGAGVQLRRYIASPELDMLDPFLLLDVFRSDDPNDYVAGFPPHPHRGFETVTYLLHGRMRHKDSAGHEGVIEPGGIQWMTAGSGIEHSEMPEQKDGLLYGFQLWVNLPARRKMTNPHYQEFVSELIPIEVRNNNVSIRVIAGTTRQKTTGPVSNVSADPLYLDITMPAGETFTENIPSEHNAFLYIIKGEIAIQGKNTKSIVPAETMAMLGDGNIVNITASPDSRFLLIAGQPFNEPVARYGPFVMNTQDEIKQAFADYQSGEFGRIEKDKE